MIRLSVLLLALGASAPRSEIEPLPAYPKGVTAQVAKSFAKGLDWLARTQGQDGAWRSAKTYGNVPVAMTAMAGMALLGSGSSLTRGPYARNLRLATDYLMRNFHANGHFTALNEEYRSMYGHGFTTLFLAQVLGMEEDVKRHRRLRSMLKKAVDLIAACQSPDGGWNYEPGDRSDEGSVTITQVQGLRACQDAGITVSRTTINNAIQYIVRSANPDGGIRYRVRNGGRSRAPITAAAVATLYNAGRYDHPMAEKALRYSLRMIPINRRMGHYYYAHKYLAQAAFQKGGKVWDKYWREMSARLTSRQSRNGSWTDGQVGPVYSTAVAVIILTLPYNRIPAYQR